MEERWVVWPECKAGWFSLQPTGGLALVSEAADQRHSVLVFGDLLSCHEASPAEIVLRTWTDGGAEAVRDIDGCFGAVILDRLNCETTLVSDVLGQRTLRYFADSQRLVVSPHDVAMVTTGLVPQQDDYVSALSIATMGWSLGGRSLLKGIDTCHPARYVRWKEGRRDERDDPIIRHDRRIEGADKKRIGATLDNMVETARASVSEIVRRGSVQGGIATELTAGVDSRAVLSLLMSTVSSTRIQAITVGEPDDLDVIVAKRLARAYGLGHASLRSSDCAAPSSDDFATHGALVAFATNGDSNAKVLAIQPLPQFVSTPPLLLCGEGGEIFRGYYYSDRDIPPLSFRDSVSRLRGYVAGVAGHESDMRTALTARLEAAIDQYADISSNPHDLLDLFYTYERFGVWGAHVRRQTWDPLRWSPFYVRHLVRSAFRLPAPVARHARIHAEVLRRFARMAYWLPVNGARRLPLEGKGPVRTGLAKLDVWSQSVLRSALGAMGRSASVSAGMGLEQLRAHAISHDLREYVADLLGARGSLAAEILSDLGLIPFYESADEQNQASLETLGVLIAIEHWRSLVKTAARSAQTVSLTLVDG
jgi:hypothetical protein